MPRIKPDPIIRDVNWDPDESAVLRGSLGYLELQRVGLALRQLGDSTISATTTDEELVAGAKALARVVLAIYRDVTLRKPGQTYQEGIERPKVDFTEDGLISPDVGIEALSFLSSRGIEHIRTFTPADEAPVPLTDAAKEAGLTAARFPDSGPDQGVLPTG